MNIVIINNKNENWSYQVKSSKFHDQFVFISDHYALSPSCRMVISPLFYRAMPDILSLSNQCLNLHSISELWFLDSVPSEETSVQSVFLFLIFLSGLRGNSCFLQFLRFMKHNNLDGKLVSSGLSSGYGQLSTVAFARCYSPSDMIYNRCLRVTAFAQCHFPSNMVQNRCH